MKKIDKIGNEETLFILNKNTQYLKMDNGMLKVNGFENKEISFKLPKEILTVLCLSIMNGTLNIRNTNFEEELYKYGQLVSVLVHKKKSNFADLIKLTSEAKMFYYDKDKQKCIHLPKREDIIPLEYQTIMYSQKILSLLINYYYAKEHQEKKNNNFQLKLIKGGKK